MAMQQFLLNNTKTFLSLLSKLHEGVLVHAQDASILYANPSAANILGFDEDFLLGKNASNHSWYFIDESYKRLSVEEHPVYRLFHGEETISHLLLGVYLEDNSFKWVDVNGSLTYNEKQEKVALIILSDVTQRKQAYDEVEFFKNLVDIVNTGITITDPNQSDNPLIYVNKAFTDMTQYQLEDAFGKNCRFLNANDREQEGLEVIRKAVKQEKSCEVVLRNYAKDGKLFYNLLNITPFFEKEKLKYFVGVQHDITYQKEQEGLLNERNLYIQSIIDAQEGLIFVNNTKQIIFANKALYAFFGVASLEEFLVKSDCVCNYFVEKKGFFHLKMLKKDESWIEVLNELPVDQRVVCIVNRDANQRYFKVAINQIVQDRYVVTLYDATYDIEKEHMLENKAYHDSLTSLYNRQYFYEHAIEQIQKSVDSIGIIMLDIDNFKSINDTYGHKSGDEVLKHLAKCVTSSLRLSDIVIRWGGEEFIAIVHTHSMKEVAMIAENLRSAVAQIEIPDIRKFTASFGITLLHQGENIDSAIGRADNALYASKAEGKNRVSAL